MRVHVVSNDWSSDWVIARLARELVDGTGWTSGEGPDASADVNLFALYLLWCRTSFKDTPTVTWFTHREDMTAGKVKMWDEAAKGVSMRLSQSPMYLDSLPRPNKWVPAPVDLEHFALARAPRHKTPVIGVAGFVYESGRKGEALAAELAQRRPEWTVKATGRGWPIPMERHTWATMPDFYRLLDVFLCTSSIEGGPVTVLEALATGVPVVVPRHVGMIDALPEMAGIYRYPAGDILGMERAIAEALDTRVNRRALREVAEEYSPDRWRREWSEAIAEVLDAPKAEVEPTPSDWRERAGCYIVAFGAPSRRCAVKAVQSFKEHMPDVPVAVVSDHPVGAEDIFIEHEDGPGKNDIGGRSAKTRIYDLAPAEWEYILYLDADTETIAPIPFFFDALQDGWDLLICVNPGKYHVAREMKRPDNLDECRVTWSEIGTPEVVQLQGGVIAFRRNERTKRFFEAWHREWQRWGKRDQGALLRAMYANPVRMLLLGNEWNLSTRYLPAQRSAGILHHQTQARRWEGVVDGRLDEVTAWRAVSRWEKRRRM